MKQSIQIRDLVMIAIGSTVTAFGITAFITPAKIASGGVSGIAVILYHAFGLEVGLMILALSLPLFIAGTKIFGSRYGFGSLVGTLLLSAATSLFGIVLGFEGFLDSTEPVDALLSALFGGVLAGFGMGLVLKGGANTGGTDIGAQIISKYTPLSVGTSLFLVDGMVIAAGGFVFGLESMLFALVSLYATSVSINFVLLRIGTRYAKTVLIISNRHESIANRILGELGHGGTLLNGTGIYTRTDRPVLMTVIPNQKISALTTIVHQEDQKAFMIIEEAYEVLGEGFSPISRR